jgi:hypothetical protein
VKLVSPGKINARHVHVVGTSCEAHARLLIQHYLGDISEDNLLYYTCAHAMRVWIAPSHTHRSCDYMILVSNPTFTGTRNQLEILLIIMADWLIW